MKLPTIYKKTTTGKTQHWTIEVENEKYRTISGQISGKDKVSEWTICFGKNPGKANETTAAEQALKEAKAKRDLKLLGEYKEKLEDVDKDIGFVLPMLAENYKDYKDEIVFPVGSQKKYNGMRCVASINGLFSRKGKPIKAAPHIMESLLPLFKKRPSMVLDGELYSHKHRHNLNRILKLVRKLKPKEKDLEQSKELIEFHLYDCCCIKKNNQLDYEERYGLLQGIATLELPHIFVAELDIAKDHKELDTLYKAYLKDEYEGQMIRKLNEVYQNKRTKFLLKRKPFIDAEFPVVDIIEGEGNRTGTAGRVVCKLPKPHPITKDETFDSNIKGDYKYLKEVLIEKKKYIGHSATVRFTSYSEYGVPQCPYVTAFNREEVEGEINDKTN